MIAKIQLSSAEIAALIAAAVAAVETSFIEIVGYEITETAVLSISSLDVEIA